MPKRPDAEQQERVLRALITVAPPILRRFWNPDSCIASTRDAVDALHCFRLRAEPLSVRTMVFNQPAWTEIVVRDRFPQSKAEREEWFGPVGGHSLGIGYGADDPSGWPGHLVVLVENRWIVDLTLPQANRPAKWVVLTPLVFEAEPALLEGKTRQVMQVNDCVVIYERAKRGDMQAEGWRTAKDWRDPKRHVEPFRLITTAMRMYLEENSALRDVLRPTETIAQPRGEPEAAGGVARGGADPEA